MPGAVAGLPSLPRLGVAAQQGAHDSALEPPPRESASSPASLGRQNGHDSRSEAVVQGAPAALGSQTQSLLPVDQPWGHLFPKELAWAASSSDFFPILTPGQAPGREPDGGLILSLAGLSDAGMLTRPLLHPGNRLAGRSQQRQAGPSSSTAPEAPADRPGSTPAAWQNHLVCRSLRPPWRNPPPHSLSSTLDTVQHRRRRSLVQAAPCPAKTLESTWTAPRAAESAGGGSSFLASMRTVSPESLGSFLWGITEGDQAKGPPGPASCASQCPTARPPQGLGSSRGLPNGLGKEGSPL